jgi:hypothetical protein
MVGDMEEEQCGNVTCTKHSEDLEDDVSSLQAKKNLKRDSVLPKKPAQMNGETPCKMSATSLKFLSRQLVVGLLKATGTLNPRKLYNYVVLGEEMELEKDLAEDEMCLLVTVRCSLNEIAKFLEREKMYHGARPLAKITQGEFLHEILQACAGHKWFEACMCSTIVPNLIDYFWTLAALDRAEVDQIPESVACIAKNPLVTRETTPSRHP